MGKDRPDQDALALSRCADLVRAALKLGAAEAEAFCKISHSRSLVLEPDTPSEASSRISVSSSAVDGMALRVLDRRGQWGFAWRSPTPRALDGQSGGTRDRVLVQEAMDSAARAGGRWPGTRSPTNGGAAPQDDLAPVSADEGKEIDLHLDDPEVVAGSVTPLENRLAEARDAALGIVGGAGFVDRIRLNEAQLAVGLANSRGFRGAYRKSLALLSISISPMSAGARTTLEERSACHMADLDFRECAVEAGLRALPARTPTAPPAVDMPVLLGPRATAALVAALAPLVLRSDDNAPRGAMEADVPRAPCRGFWLADAARLPGAAGSSPFDGAGWKTGESIVMAGGRPTGRLLTEHGHRVRPSYREPPAVGLTNLRLVGPDSSTLSMPEGSCLRVAAAQFVPGPLWTIRILRGDWHAAGGEANGPADGFAWVGPLEAILGGAVAVGSDRQVFHIGIPIGAASLAIEGLRGWFVERRVAPGVSSRKRGAYQAVSEGRSRSKTE